MRKTVAGDWWLVTGNRVAEVRLLGDSRFRFSTIRMLLLAKSSLATNNQRPATEFPA